MNIVIRRTQRKDAPVFLKLIDALADYEKLARPTTAARRRLLRDGFGANRKFDSFLVFADREAAGYAIIFETYSSFLARPTLYLEDIFILPEFRGKGIGKKLFERYRSEAQRRKCGRMEWVVLDWNTPAIDFYEHIGASQLKGWLTYRIVL